MNAARAPLAFLLLLAACAGAPPAPEPAATGEDPSRPLPLPLPDVVARVNDQPIRIHQILPLAKAALDRTSVAEREKRKPEVVRKALDDYIARELLLQEAIRRGVAADSRDVEWRYDQMRGQYPAEADWLAFLQGQGMDAQGLKAELRVQAMVQALVAKEIEEWPVPEAQARAAYAANPRGFGPPGAAEPPSFEAARAEVERAVRGMSATEIQAALVARLRSQARIERFI